MAWMKGALLLALTLAGGIIIGVSYERQSTPAHVAPGSSAHDAMHHFTRELGLDSMQRQAIAAIFARRQGAVDSTWHAVQPHVRATMDSAHQEIVRVLRPDQLATFRLMAKARHQP